MPMSSLMSEFTFMLKCMFTGVIMFMRLRSCLFMATPMLMSVPVFMHDDMVMIILMRMLKCMCMRMLMRLFMFMITRVHAHPNPCSRS